MRNIYVFRLTGCLLLNNSGIELGPENDAESDERQAALTAHEGRIWLRSLTRSSASFE